MYIANIKRIAQNHYIKYRLDETRAGMQLLDERASSWEWSGEGGEGGEIAKSTACICAHYLCLKEQLIFYNLLDNS